jgi:S1-C subfamily serine protease
MGVAESYDLAVLHIGGVRQLPPAVNIGTSSDLKVGQWAFAIGNPFGLDGSLTTGVISALKRRLPTSAGREIGNVIQTDAAINPGNPAVLGDVIVAVNGDPVRRLADLTDRLEQTGVGKSVELSSLFRCKSLISVDHHRSRPLCLIARA